MRQLSSFDLCSGPSSAALKRAIPLDTERNIGVHIGR
jgi:hypothetical protein